MGVLSRSKPTYGQGGGQRRNSATRRRAYPSAESLTELREGREYGRRGNARHRYGRDEGKKK